jgi:hypothetical protein
VTPSTFYRYLSAVFEDDKTSVGSKNISDEEVLNQMAIARDRLLKQSRDVMEKTVNNP